MRKSKWILAGLLALPAIAWADETPAPAIKPSFDIRADSVRKVIRETAASQYGSYEVADPEAGPEMVSLRPGSAPAGATPLSLDHFDCDAHHCVARDQHHKPMYVVENEDTDSTRYVRTWQDPWLGGQSREATQTRPCATCGAAVADDKSFAAGLRDDLLGNLIGGLLNSLFRKP